MNVREMFAADVERKINGVVKVGEDDSIEQEIREYVVTTELRRHFASFFNYYSEAFTEPTGDVGVWISGFFGSGKSHLLKILSYLLENKTIGGTKVVDAFREKFADDPLTFGLVDQSTRGETETILFNIDAKSPVKKDATAVLRVFARTFYDHLGYKGDDLKVVELEKYLQREGKSEAFRTAIEERSGGQDWEQIRKSFGFKKKVIAAAIADALEIDVKDAERWLEDKTAADQFNIEQLVDDVKAYVDSKPKNFRLLFMADEVGQYVGDNVDRLLNLQTIVEELGSRCKGKVWVVCTGQEALGQLIKIREAAFSKIQARFRLRLSLSSSSVGEVIQKRILAKKESAEKKLEKVYGKHESELRNLFCFQDARTDVEGFANATEFAACFPFVPYQFIVVQKVFSAISKRAIKGANMSIGERSMLSGFQEAVKSVLDRDENALVPFSQFFSSLFSFLDVDVRNVFERCEKAAEEKKGLEPKDVELLKLLYLLRDIDDIHTNVENLTILTADSIDVDKIKLRDQVTSSLHRLQIQNYVGRNGEIYFFLTDEEQDIRRGIRETPLDVGEIVNAVSKLIYGGIYTDKKFHDKSGTDFDFDKFVDEEAYSQSGNVMQLRFLTELMRDKPHQGTLIAESSKNQAIVAIDQLSFAEDLEYALKTRKFVKHSDLKKYKEKGQQLIEQCQLEAARREMDASEHIKRAIETAECYVMGEKLELPETDAKTKINAAMEYLVSQVYKKMGLVVKKAKDDKDVLAILNGLTTTLDGVEGTNDDATAEIEKYLSRQNALKLQTTMADVQAFFHKEPFGWREVDIAALVAQLFAEDKITLKRSGALLWRDNPNIPDYLRKKTEISKTAVAIRVLVDPAKIKKVVGIFKEYLNINDVPVDEVQLAAFVVASLEEKLNAYSELEKKYQDNEAYPGRDKLEAGRALLTDVLSCKKDNEALFDRVIKLEDALFDRQEAVQKVVDFFENQAPIFDEACRVLRDAAPDLDYLEKIPDARKTRQTIEEIVRPQGEFNYRRIPELNQLVDALREVHDRLLEDKRRGTFELFDQCLDSLRDAAKDDPKTADVLEQADGYYAKQKDETPNVQSLTMLDGLQNKALARQKELLEQIETALAPPAPEPDVTAAPEQNGSPAPAEKKKIVKKVNRQLLFPAKRLASDEEIDAYVEEIRARLKSDLTGCDEIQLD